MSGDLENLVFGLIERYMSGGTAQLGGNTFHERHGLITSYDPERHLAKVMFKPEDQESDWLPVETGHIGDNFGIAIGLTPGDGKASGDQVVIRYQQGDLASAKIVQRVHSDQDKPPKVESGEAVIWTRFTKSGTQQSGIGDDSTEQGGDQVGESGAQAGSGQQIFFKKDGSLTWTDGNGATIAYDGKGAITVTSTNNTITVNSKGDTTVNSQANVVVNAAEGVTVNAESFTANAVNELGGSSGKQAARMGTVDTGGYMDVAGLATKVFVT